MNYIIFLLFVNTQLRKNAPETAYRFRGIVFCLSNLICETMRIILDLRHLSSASEMTFTLRIRIAPKVT